MHNAAVKTIKSAHRKPGSSSRIWVCWRLQGPTYGNLNAMHAQFSSTGTITVYTSRGCVL